MIDLEATRRALPMPDLLRKVGLGENAKTNGKTCCPWHPDKTPSFTVSEHNGRWSYKCWAGCCEPGDEVDLVQKTFALATKGEAIKRYAELAGTDSANGASKPSIVSEAKRILGATLSGGVATPLVRGVKVNGLAPRDKAQLDAKLPEDSAPPAQFLSGTAISQLAKWRGYARVFAEHIAKAGIVKVFDGCIAFPVTGGFHYRKQDGSWRYSKGAKAGLFVPGKLEEGAQVHCFESQWDCLAYAESQGELDNIVASRGAGNARLISERLKGHTGALYLWPQNDAPGQKWASDIRDLLPDAQIKRAIIPEPHKDLADWRKAGATSGAVWNAFVDAIPFPAPTQAEPLSLTQSGGGEVLESDTTMPRLETEASEPHCGLRHPEKGTDSSGGENTLSGGLNVATGVPKAVALAYAQNTFPAPTDDNRTVRLVSEPGAANLSGTLDSIVAFLCRYVSFALEEQALAIALWVCHSHVFEAFRFSPYLHICSPEKRCGKTRLLESLQLLCPRTRTFVRPSEPVLFRTIQREKPTLLLDEIDTIFGKEGGKDESSEGLRAVLNAGFQAGVKIPRCVGNNHEIAEFSVFCPKVISGIGKIPDTVRDRSIEIRLVRQTEEGKAARFRHGEATDLAAPIVSALEEWAREASLALADARPDIPEQLSDRAADMCEPLLAIAESAGAEWATKGREALIALSASNEDTSEGVQLLASCREVFAMKDRDRIPTHDLLEALIGMESADAPWATWWESDIKKGNGKAPAMRLARMLEPYGIKPISMKTNDGHDGEKTVKGYHSSDFRDAFKRYLSPVKGMATMEMAL